VFWLLYRYAWSCRGELELTPLEQLRTRQSMMDESAMVLLGIVSILLAQLAPRSAVYDAKSRQACAGRKPGGRKLGLITAINVFD